MSRVGRVMAFARRRRRAVLVATLVFSVLCALLCLRISFGTDVLALLPQSSPPLQAFREYLGRFGAEGQLYVLFEVPDGARVEDASDLIEAYLARLATLPEIDRIDAGLFEVGRDWTYLQDREFALIGPARTREAVERLGPAGMRTALAHSRDLLSTPSPVIRDLVQSDPLGLFSFVRDHFAGDRTFAGLDVTQQGYVSADGRSRLVIAMPRGAPFDSDFCHRLFARLDETEAAARHEILTDDTALRIEYAGGYRIAVETEAIIRREARLNGVSSVVAILLLLLVVFRSPWLFLVGAIPMTVATVASIAVNGILHRQLSAAATGTSALLFGLGIDGLVLLYTRYLEEREAGFGADQAVQRLSGAGTSMLLGCVTTAATFLGLTWIDLPGLQELGRLVGVGMLLGGPLTLVLVAALLPRTGRKARAPTAEWLPIFVRTYRWPILVGAGLLTAVALPVMMQLHLDLRLQRLQPDTPAVRTQQELGRRFGVDRDVVLATAEGTDLNALLALDRRFAAELAARAPQLSVSGPSRLIPPAEDQEQTALTLQALNMDGASIQRALRSAGSEAGFRADALREFINRLPSLLDSRQRLTYDGYVQHGLRDIVARFVAPTDRGFLTVAYVVVNNENDLAQAGAAAAAVGAPLTLTGLPIVNAELARHFTPQFSLGLAIGCAAVFLLMLVTFKRVSLTLLALSPTIVGLIWSSAILAWLGVDLDLFSIFAILTLIGIGVDYGIHLVHRCSSEADSLDRAVARIVPANMVAAGIALLGCGSLVTSAYAPLRSLGIVTVVGLCACLVTAVLLLPALLMVLPRHIRTSPENPAAAITRRKE